jgi:hypothetical protein
VYQKAGDRIKPTATWKHTKSIWMLRTARSYLDKLIKEIKEVGNEDVHALLQCLQTIDEIISRQIDFVKDKGKKGD